MRISIGVASILLAAMAGPVTAQGVDEVVQTAAQAFMAANPQAAGMAIGVVKDGKTYFYNFGVANRQGALPVTSDTLFPIASVTKTFTGTLLADAQLGRKAEARR